MTQREAEKLGYAVIPASAFEVGLTKNGRGLRTWFSQEFDGHLPTLEHPKIQEAITVQEQLERNFPGL